MDNFIFIGYRFDVEPQTKDDKDSWSVASTLEKQGISIYSLPGKEWLMWSNLSSTLNILYMGNKVQNDYTCPIDRCDLYEWAKDSRNFPTKLDLPDNHEENVKILMRSKLYGELVEMFGMENITLRWGIYMGLG
jgi:hypothetical protein